MMGMSALEKFMNLFIILNFMFCLDFHFKYLQASFVTSTVILCVVYFELDCHISAYFYSFIGSCVIQI